MGKEVTREERQANIKHWRFQHQLMSGQGFNLVTFNGKVKEWV